MYSLIMHGISPDFFVQFTFIFIFLVSNWTFAEPLWKVQRATRAKDLKVDLCCSKYQSLGMNQCTLIPGQHGRQTKV